MQGSQFGEAFTPEPGEFVVSGRTGASGFAGSNLDSFLRNQEIKKIYIAGYAFHVCVESTLRHGHDLGYEIRLSKTRHPLLHKNKESMSSNTYFIISENRLPLINSLRSIFLNTVN
ncbi:isochorismatase family protein [Paenibacillus farraposensis]|uniref:Isochorismatase family protein n=1 Tax=Paenibacillus farraposensis TaxID=2807095 RepID=A0ABW4D991_9BACL|nr:isochorismatase family protein [Paenibacillus farraposensis]